MFKCDQETLDIIDEVIEANGFEVGGKEWQMVIAIMRRLHLKKNLSDQALNILKGKTSKEKKQRGYMCCNDIDVINVRTGRTNRENENVSE